MNQNHRRTVASANIVKRRAVHIRGVGNKSIPKLRHCGVDLLVGRRLTDCSPRQEEEKNKTG